MTKYRRADGTVVRASHVLSSVGTVSSIEVACFFDKEIINLFFIVRRKDKMELYLQWEGSCGVYCKGEVDGF